MSLRMPLVPGDGAVGLLFLFSAAGAPWFGALTACAGPTWGLGLGSAGWGLGALALAGLVWALGPVDAELGPAGLTFDDGRQIPLEDLPRLELVEDGRDHVLRLDGDELARVSHPEEAASLGALVSTARAAATSRAPSRDPGPEVRRCAGCAAPCVPVDLPVAPCVVCGLEAPVPDAERAVAGATAVKPAVRHALTRLTDWPSARRVRGVLVAAALAAGLGWPAVTAVGLAAGRLDALDLATLGAVGFNLGVTLPLFALRLASDRRAFAWIGARYAAPPPLRDEPHACRSCAGPLPDPLGRSAVPAVARCAYCGTDSVVGLGLLQEAEDVRAGAVDLLRDASARVAERNARTRYLLLSGVVLLATPWMLADLLLQALR